MLNIDGNSKLTSDTFLLHFLFVYDFRLPSCKHRSFSLNQQSTAILQYFSGNSWNSVPSTFIRSKWVRFSAFNLFRQSVLTTFIWLGAHQHNSIKMIIFSHAWFSLCWFINFQNCFGCTITWFILFNANETMLMYSVFNSSNVRLCFATWRTLAYWSYKASMLSIF